MELSWFKKIKEKIKSFFKKEEKVPQGIQVFDENGKTVVDITDRLTQIVGVKTLTKIEESGSIDVSVIDGAKVWFNINLHGLPGNPYIMWVSGNTIHYKIHPEQRGYLDAFKNGGCILKIIYGVC